MICVEGDSMVVESFDIVFYTAIFVLPGFLISCIIDATNPPRRYNEGIYLLKCLIYSIEHYAVWSWAYSLLFNHDFKYFTIYWMSIVLTTLIGATIISILIVFIKQKQILYIVFEKIGIKSIHSTPTAWDYKFSKQESDFVIVTLIDNTIIRGLYCTDSFSSSDYEERDLYLEKLYVLSNKHNWVEAKDNNGVYIAKNQIKYIEFLRGE